MRGIVLGGSGIVGHIVWQESDQLHCRGHRRRSRETFSDFESVILVRVVSGEAQTAWLRVA
jgi:hypothetical protein